MTNEDTDIFPTYWEMYNQFRLEGDDEEFAHNFASSLSRLSSEVLYRFGHWWKTGELLDDLEVNGIRVSTFWDRDQHTVPSAFLEFDRFWQNPDDDQMVQAFRDGGIPFTVLAVENQETGEMVYSAYVAQNEEATFGSQNDDATLPSQNNDSIIRDDEREPEILDGFPSFNELVNQFVSECEPKADAESHARTVLGMSVEDKNKFLDWWKGLGLEDDFDTPWNIPSGAEFERRMREHRKKIDILIFEDEEEANKAWGHLLTGETDEEHAQKGSSSPEGGKGNEQFWILRKIRFIALNCLRFATFGLIDGMLFQERRKLPRFKSVNAV
ncbi:hypothetical protein IQ273_02275 [Nodosilinea sp. LEGE 07298]|uniref:hypothetical protein n=1 Tax=Nodosilinea sp. LEGE 07298 TaxID=2777970 RepID=UPI001881C0DE|nr:hypothetical protein [Nodosilinea sp. LEGE 07298]MBE9108248.1 hypothetical protein [Nodosilinea sp. LEGE 07298]